MSDRNLNPHAEARVAMSLWSDRYSKQTLGCMDFYDGLTAAQKATCAQIVDGIIYADRADGRTPAPSPNVMGSEPPLDWSNFEGPKRNVEWKPDDQELIYTAINYRDDEYGDADEDVGQQLVERLLAAWKTFAVSEQITFENAARLLRERDEARADVVAAKEITDFLYKHGDLTYSAAARAVQLLAGNGFGFTSSSSQRRSELLIMRKALNKIADMIDAEDSDLDDAITIARAALSSPMGGGE